MTVGPNLLPPHSNNDAVGRVRLNRAIFLDALRSGDYPKGPIEVDSRGTPYAGAEGWCAVGLAHTLFSDPARPGSLVPVRKALGMSRAQMTRLQQEWNDSYLTFPEIADLVEQEIYTNGSNG